MNPWFYVALALYLLGIFPVAFFEDPSPWSRWQLVARCLLWPVPVSITCALVLYEFASGSETP